jgi:hypothetical protein
MPDFYLSVKIGEHPKEKNESCDPFIVSCLLFRNQITPSSGFMLQKRG